MLVARLYNISGYFFFLQWPFSRGKIYRSATNLDCELRNKMRTSIKYQGYSVHQRNGYSREDNCCIFSWIVKKNCPCQLHEKSIAPTFIFILSKARSSSPTFYDVTKSIFRLTFWWTLFLSTIRNHKSIKKYTKYSTKWRSFSVVSNLTTKYRIQLLHFFVSL